MSPIVTTGGGGLQYDLSGFQRSGAYYFPAATAATSSSAGLGTGTLRVVSIVVPRSLSITRIGAEVTVVGDAGSLVRLGIYADDGTGQPGALILDAGTIAGDSATVQEIVVSTTLATGIYYLGGVVQNVSVTQPTVRTITGTPAVVNAGSALPAAGVSVVGYTLGGVVGALPASGAFVVGSGSAPRVFLKTA